MSYQVTIEPTGEQIEVEDGQTILQAALRQGVWLPFACGHGTCATCKLQVLKGDVDVGAASSFALMDMERDEGKVLACCAIPQSDLVIEADIDVDPDFAGHTVQDYRAEVVALDDLSPTIKGLRLKLDRPMEFQAGQYINLQIPGIDGTRAFSLANPPSRTDEVELHVRLVEGGQATGFPFAKKRQDAQADGQRTGGGQCRRAKSFADAEQGRGAAHLHHGLASRREQGKPGRQHDCLGNHRAQAVEQAAPRALEQFDAHGKRASGNGRKAETGEQQQQPDHRLLCADRSAAEEITLGGSDDGGGQQQGEHRAAGQRKRPAQAPGQLDQPAAHLREDNAFRRRAHCSSTAIASTGGASPISPLSAMNAPKRA